MYAVQILTVVGLYIILASGMNLSVGFAGLISLSHGVLYATGAYTSTILIMDLGVPFEVAMAVGVVCAAALAGLMSIILLRLGDDYFVVATMGLQLIGWSVLNNWSRLTRGPLGIPGIPEIRIFGLNLSGSLPFLAFVSLTAALVVLGCHRLGYSPYGRVLRAIREDPTFAMAMGKDVTFFKVTVMTVGGAMAGLAGALYAPFLGFIDPTGFTLAESLLILSMVIVGGAGTLRGPILGAIVLIVFPELLRFLGLPPILAGNVRQIMYGSLLVVMMLFRPQGILGSYRFERRDNPAM